MVEKQTDNHGIFIRIYSFRIPTLDPLFECIDDNII